MSFLANDHTFKSMPRATCSSHSQPLNTDHYKHQSKTLGYEADCKLDGKDRPTEWFQYVLEDTSSNCVPMEEGYTQVTPAKLAFMIKVELEVKATPKPKKSKESKPKPFTNHATNSRNSIWNIQSRKLNFLNDLFMQTGTSIMIL